MKYLLVSFSCFVLVGSAHAIVIQYDGPTAFSQTANVSEDGGATFTNTYVGILNLHYVPSGPSFTAVCVDLAHNASGGTAWDSNIVSSTVGGAGIQRAAAIVAANFNSVTTADQGAGLQAAVWDAIYDNGASFDEATGLVQFSGLTAGAITAAQGFYNDRTGSGAATWYQRQDFPDGSYSGQDMMGPVPEPCSIIALATGLAGFVARRRRK